MPSGRECGGRPFGYERRAMDVFEEKNRAYCEQQRTAFEMVSYYT